MGWRETCVMEERMKFINGCHEGVESIAALCRLFGISRKTGYKLLKRYKVYGMVQSRKRKRRCEPYTEPFTEGTNGCTRPSENLNGRES